MDNVAKKNQQNYRCLDIYFVINERPRPSRAIKNFCKALMNKGKYHMYLWKASSKYFLFSTSAWELGTPQTTLYHD